MFSLLCALAQRMLLILTSLRRSHRGQFMVAITDKCRGFEADDIGGAISITALFHE
ncbi:hypothetical protein [uncultured Ralstonia sp.]|jgi:hypothetical protein|uniref:hypothetical protein n=1 Tax=Ralstonia sp. TaxID=54061 RepID=UPI001EA936C1|nr:hypothetical protein [uncultured Ralstonia sp.]UCF22319.1 MAG: hypothetical protein JSV72_15285 [Ralstonia sp.]